MNHNRHDHHDQHDHLQAEPHRRSSGRHRAGVPARRKAVLLTVASVIVAGGSCMLLIRPGSEDHRALAAEPSTPVPPTTSATAPDTPSTSRSPKAHRPTAAPSKAERQDKQHVSPRRHTTSPDRGSDNAPSAAPQTPHTDSGAGGAAPAGTGGAKGTAAAFAQKIVELVNDQRAQHGCGPLTVDPHIQAAAQAHSDDMAARNYYEHNTPEGVDPGTRMTRAGFPWQSWAENIFKSPKDPATAMDGWMKSPGHRDNILNCSYKSTGVGVNLSANGPWWTQDFATHS